MWPYWYPKIPSIQFNLFTLFFRVSPFGSLRVSARHRFREIWLYDSRAFTATSQIIVQLFPDSRVFALIRGQSAFPITRYDGDDCDVFLTNREADAGAI
jgi:hypothetical protein